MSSSSTEHADNQRSLSAKPSYFAVSLWITELVIAFVFEPQLNEMWPAWRTGLLTIAIWGLNLLVLWYGVGPPLTFSRIPMLSVVFGFVMTAFGCANYWATTQRFPVYRVFIERAALFVAVCTLFSLLGCVAIARVSSLRGSNSPRSLFTWNWGRVRLLTYVLLPVCVLGTYVSIRRIGYVPLVQGDPESARLTYSQTAGIWLRLSAQVGIILALIVGAQICARRATWGIWVVGIVAIVCASIYGNRFFAALPVGATFLLWDRVRSRIPVRTVGMGYLLGVPTLALIGFWRYQESLLDVLSPLMLVLYGTLMEFRDLAWAMDYYSGGHPFLHGSTIGSMFMPLLPSPFWTAVGIDKAALYAHSNAAVLGQQMWQLTPQRIGIYGELFMNFGWLGAFGGAALYGACLGYVDLRFRSLRTTEAVRGIVLAVVGVVLVYAQMGQWDMDVTAITSTCYPILLLALVAANRRKRLDDSLALAGND
jgi:hypothetical protein